MVMENDTMVVNLYEVEEGKYNIRLTESYGYYYSREDAERVMCELEKCNWDKSQLPYIRDRLGLNAHKNYSPCKLKNGVIYGVNKMVDGKRVYFGSYRDEDTAKKIVDELKKVGWNKALLPRIQEKVLGKKEEE